MIRIFARASTLAIVVSLLLNARRFGDDEAVVGVVLAHSVVRGSQGCRDPGAEVDTVTDEALVGILHGLDQRFTRVGTGVKDRNRSAIESLACSVGEFRCVKGVGAGLVRIDDELAAGNLLLKEWEHRRFVFAHADGAGDRVLEEVGNLLCVRGLRNAADLRLKRRGVGLRAEGPAAVPASTPARAIAGGAAAGCALATAPAYTVGATGLSSASSAPRRVMNFGAYNWLMNEIGLPETSDRWMLVQSSPVVLSTMAQPSSARPGAIISGALVIEQQPVTRFPCRHRHDVLGAHVARFRIGRIDVDAALVFGARAGKGCQIVFEL